MPQTLLEMAKALTHTLVETGRLSVEDMQVTLQKIHAILIVLKEQEETGTLTTLPHVQTPPVDWRKSITRYAVTCLECGDTFKQLSSRHLRQHGLDARSYRTKYGIPRTQALTARATTERRRQIVREIRPWERSPTFRKGQALNGQPSPEPEAEAVQDETEAASAAAPAQPKRQRKTSPKKTARRTRAEG